MLVQSSRLRAQRDVYETARACLEQIYLPWLCPSLLERGRQSSNPPSTARIHYISKGCRSIPCIGHLPRANPPHTRRLASAAAVALEPAQDSYIPFEGGYPSYQPSISSQSPWSGKPNLSALKIFDPSSLLILNDSLATSPPRFRTVHGIGGELDDIHQTLNACLRVGRLERASTMLERLNKLHKPEDPSLVKAHNDYLRVLLEKVARTKNQETLRQLRRWFEVNIRAEGIPPNATTYALMIESAFKEFAAKKLDRTVRRYIDLSEQAGLRNEAIQLTNLTEEEWTKVTKIGPSLLDFETGVSNRDEQGSIGLPASGQTIPELTPVDLKGPTLKALKESISLFSERTELPYPHDLEGTQEEKDHLYATMRQQRLEEDTLNSAIERWRQDSVELKKAGVNNMLKSGSVGSLMWDWHEALIPLIKNEIREANAAEKRSNLRAEDLDRATFGPFLQFLPPETLSAITILNCISVLSTEGIEKGSKVGHLVSRVGAAVRDESFMGSVKLQSKQQPLRVNSGQFSAVARERILSKFINKSHSSHSSVLSLARSPVFESTDLAAQIEQWSPAIMARIGAVLLSKLIEAAKMQVSHTNTETNTVSNLEQAVFFHAYQYTAGKRVGIIRLNPAMTGILCKEPVKAALAKHLPMVSEPAPWTGFKKGGFLHYPVSVVRIGSGDDQLRQYAGLAAANGDMDQVFAGLDVLAKTPWKINRGVFEVMLTAWNTGEEIGKIAPSNPEIRLPPEPEAFDDPKAHQAWKREIREAENLRKGLHSQRCFQNFQLEIARAYLEEKFYFPHNLDFRGRAYPVPPYLNHMGADTCRGLLMFWKGKELGATGLVWLKVHLANVFGFDKANFDERRDFTMANLVQVYDSAKNPLNGNRWWLKAEDPWQCLAACIELKNALDAPDPHKYVSHLAIHQDGTCNGLQHYAALGGDVIGAKQVNLEPGDRPSDIYTAVAEMVKAGIAHDADLDVEIAKALDGKVTRKIVKQTVMTNVYGVTFVGARRQVRRQLVDALPDFLNTSSVNYDKAAAYIARKIFDALSTMFTGAHDIQHWLGDCATRICESLTPEQMSLLENKSAQDKIEVKYKMKPIEPRYAKDQHAQFKSGVIWTTPLKMPVVQPYRKSTAQRVVTNLQRISIQQRTASNPVIKQKQLSAFPPNFIHSLDATHMLLSALKCSETGLTFAAVHDSFWTHAADVDVMNQVLRDAFILMHSEDIIGRLAAEFSARYKGCMYLAAVDASSAVGQKIIKLRKSKVRAESNPGRSTLIQDLLRERRRLQLLASENQQERREGEEMLTPMKVFSEIADGKDLLPPDNARNVAIGQIPKRVHKMPANEQREVGDVSNAGYLEPGADIGTSLTGDVLDTKEEQENIDDVSQIETPKTTRKNYNKVRFWLPLSFPPVPKKGDFDVSRLKDSRYFFS